MRINKEGSVFLGTGRDDVPEYEAIPCQQSSLVFHR